MSMKDEVLARIKHHRTVRDELRALGVIHLPNGFGTPQPRNKLVWRGDALWCDGSLFGVGLDDLSRRHRIAVTTCVGTRGPRIHIIQPRPAEIS